MAPHRATAAEGRPLPPNIRRERECPNAEGYPELALAEVIDFPAAPRRARGDLSGIDHALRAAFMPQRAAWDEGLRYQRRADALAGSAYRWLSATYRSRADLYFDRAMGG